MIKHLLILFFTMLTISSFAQINMAKFNSESNSGIVCALPKKSFIIEINYVEETAKPGIYADYAEDLLGIDKIISSEKKSYYIENIIIKPFTEPDENAKYSLTYENLSKTDKETAVFINQSGIFYGLGDRNTTMANTLQKDILQTLPFSNNYYNNEQFNQLSAVYSSKKSTDTIIYNDSIETSISIVTNTEEITIEEKAEEAVESMMTIRQQNHDLLAGYQETGYSVETIKYMSTKLANLESAYLSLFVGSTSKIHKTHSIIFSPTSDQSNVEIPVLCFSEESGICHSTKNTNSQITISIIPREKIKKNEEEFIVSGLKYRYPVMTEMYIKYKNNIITGGMYIIPQMGKIMNIDVTKNKSVLLNPETGMIEKIY